MGLAKDDPRTFGFVKLKNLAMATSLFDINRRRPGDGKPAVMYAREKRARPASLFNTGVLF